MPEGAVYVARPSRWGNPYEITADVSRERAIALYEEYLKKMSRRDRAEFLKPLHGRDLACWCPLNVPCHADVLLKWANQ